MSGTVADFFRMSGYWAFVWGSFALGFGIVLLNVWLARRALVTAERDARRRMEISR